MNNITNRSVLLAGCALAAADTAQGRIFRSPEGHTKGGKASSPSQTTVEGQADTVQADVQSMPADTAENIVQFAGRKGGKGGFAAFNAKRTEAVQNKVELLKQANEKLAEAAALDRSSLADETKANEPAEQGALILFKAVTAGVISNDELSETLGRHFGWKQKQNGEDSKTPARLGEVIRKRVVRASKAYDYAIAGNEPVAFFEPLDADEVAAMVRDVENGNRSIWRLYNDLAEAKADATGKRPKAVFDPKRIAALTRDLAADISVSVATIQRTPGLFAAYAGLMQMLVTLDAEIPAPAEETEAA